MRPERARLPGSLCQWVDPVVEVVAGVGFVGLNFDSKICSLNFALKRNLIDVPVEVVGVAVNVALVVTVAVVEGAKDLLYFEFLEERVLVVQVDMKHLTVVICWRRL